MERRHARRSRIRGRNSRRQVVPDADDDPFARQLDATELQSDFAPLIASSNNDPLGYPSSYRGDDSRYRQSSLRPMNVAASTSAVPSGSRYHNKESTSAYRYDSESSEDAPLLSASLSESPTFLGVEDRSYQATRKYSNNRSRSHRRGNNASYAWDQAGVGGTVIRNSSPVTHVGCCHSGCCCIQCVRTGEIGVLQTFGRFERLLKPGLICMCWPITTVGRLSLRVQQVDVAIETKTKDNVFVTVGLAIQFKVVKEDAWDAYYRLSKPAKQIEAVVFDTVRSTIPKIDLDELFESKSDIATEVQRQIQYIRQFGFEIVDTLLTSISPVLLVKNSMNEMNASKRTKDAAPHKAEGEKVAKVKAAEAAAERAYLNGVGVARARKAIASSMKKSLQSFDANEKDVLSPKHVMDLLLVSHYMDTLASLGAESIILNHSPQEIADLEEQISTYFTALARNEAGGTEPVAIPDLLS